MNNLSNPFCSHFEQFIDQKAPYSPYNIFYYRYLRGLAVCLSFCLASVSTAATLFIPLDPLAKRPASDLIFEKNGGASVLSSDRAYQLAKSGLPLWTLNPEGSLLWSPEQTPNDSPTNQTLSSAEPVYPAEASTLYFNSYLASVKGIFRASVDGPSPFTLSVSLSNPAAVIRSRLLKKMGYTVHQPQSYRELTVKFSSFAERDLFIEKMSDASLTSRKRWIKFLSEKDPSVVLQGVVLEPARIQIQAVYWGLMTRGLQQERREFRGLLVPYIWVDYLEKINSFAWDIGARFNNGLTFDYLLSDSFNEVSIDDVRWAVALISKISIAEIESAVEAAKLPGDVSKLLVEKLVARRNSWIKLTDLNSLASSEPQFNLLPVKTDLSVGQVQGGQLTSGDFDGYPQEFWVSPEESPLRFSELWRYFLVEGISSGIGEVLKLANQNLLTFGSVDKTLKQRQLDLQQGIQNYLFRYGKLQGFSQDIGVWSAPLGSVSVNGARSVVAGTYLGSDSKVQLVDTLSVSAQAGLFLGMDGFKSLTPGMRNAVIVSRTYVHAKPVLSLETALGTDWSDLLIPKFMAGLSQTLEPNPACEISQDPFKTEFEIDGQKFWKVEYDQNKVNGKEEAIAFRQKLIDQGLPEGNILLQAFDRGLACKAEVELKQSKNLSSFLETLAQDSTFMITDLIRFGTGVSVGVPVGSLMAALQGANVTPSVEKSFEVARTTWLRRTSNGFQVYVTDRRLDQNSVTVGASYYTQLLKALVEGQTGDSKTAYFDIPTDQADPESTHKALRGLKSLLEGGNAEILADEFKPMQIRHEVGSWLRQLKVLFWSNEEQELEHEVVLQSPNDLTGTELRTLGLVRKSTRAGLNWFSFFLNWARGGGLPSGDPGNGIGGESVTAQITAEAELTLEREFNPILLVDTTYRGWEIDRNKLFGLFDSIEAQYSNLSARSSRLKSFVPMQFHRDIFAQSESLQMYQISVNWVLYPSAIEKIQNFLNHYSDSDLRRRLTSIGGQTLYTEDCRDSEWFGSERFSASCTPGWVSEVIKLRKQPLETATKEGRKLYLKRLQRIFTLLLEHSKAGPSEWLKRLTPKDFFLVAKVSGFRKGDQQGGIQYLSDSAGLFDSQLGAGIFKDFSNLYGVAPYELYALYFTDGL